MHADNLAGGKYSEARNTNPALCSLLRAAPGDKFDDARSEQGVEAGNVVASERLGNADSLACINQ